MIDVVSASIAAIPRGGLAAYGLSFAAGIVTSIGPCIAPRYVAIAALAERGRAAAATLAFIAGLIAAYDALGLVAGLLGGLFDLSVVVYAVLAIAMIACGCWTLVTTSAGHAHAVRAPASFGGAFLLGAGSALVVSPCCTPIVAAIVAAAAATGRPFDGMPLLTTFAVGHAMPLVVAAIAGSSLLDVIRRLMHSQAPGIIAGSLMIALGAYYGFLA